MRKNSLKDEANALLVQKQQVGNAQDKLVEVNRTLDALQKKQNQQQSDLDDLLRTMEAFLEEKGCKDFTLDKADEQEELKALNAKLNSMSNQENSIPLIEKLDSVDFNENMSWEDYLSSYKDYAQRNHIDLNKDPFESLMSPSQKAEMQRRLEEEFTFKGA
ncbi:hypothetical protein, partial [Helicobacter japonicus]